MTDQEKRIKMAEACGIPLVEELGIRYKNGSESWGNSPEYTVQKCENYQLHGVGCELIKRKVPADSDFDPQNDLNAMAKVEFNTFNKTSDKETFAECQSRLNLGALYRKNLRSLVAADYTADLRHPTQGWVEFATASQRFEAFGKTLNLW